MGQSDEPDRRIPAGYRAAFEVLGLMALLFCALFRLAVASATCKAHEPMQPETEFRVHPTEVIYPKYGAVAIYWDGTYTVIDQVTWLDKTGAYGYEYSKHSSNECGTSSR